MTDIEYTTLFKNEDHFPFLILEVEGFSWRNKIFNNIILDACEYITICIAFPYIEKFNNLDDAVVLCFDLNDPDLQCSISLQTYLY